MQVKKAISVEEAKLKAFLAEANGLTISANIYNGYVIEHLDKIICWFELERFTELQCWLKQLFILREEALKLPYVFEYILQFMKAEQVQCLYVHSDRLVTDLLLESLSFSVREDKPQTLRCDKVSGTWWTYDVS